MSFGKKGLGISQVFIFIVAAITFALIAIFGYKAITDFLSSGEQVQFVQFKNDLENSIKQIYTEYGSTRQEAYRLPARFTKVCFVDLDYGDIAKELPALCQEDAFACDIWQTANEVGGYENIEQNIFLTPPSPVPIKTHNIKIHDQEGNEIGFLCLPITKGFFSLMLEGRGSHTRISKIQINEQ
jgi:hypothetical protein